ncbi:MAG: prenyltransferase/squalene oxidase repeat-containing protein [Planctomycetota bacterium]|nr:prenyltransferase/squalene oxidase repeat-containing protein [Planctomycetota bacterium]
MIGLLCSALVGHGPLPEDAQAAIRSSIQRGLASLEATADPRGGWLRGTDEPLGRPPEIPIAVSALVLKGVAQFDPDLLEQTSFQKARALIDQALREDGAFEGGLVTNYVTSCVVSALAVIEGPEDPRVQDGVAWLKKAQWDGVEGHTPESNWYGGAGYGKHQRPDLSNTQTMLDALRDAGVPPEDEAFQRALAFITRAQNRSGSNPASWAGDDGGFVYTPAGEGESKVKSEAGSLRSYGSMTYAGFKSLLYAGLDVEDPRVQAALDWLRRHWTLEENPGLGSQGYFYYLHVMSRALRAFGEDSITDNSGKIHDWRRELAERLLALQEPDGSWVNRSSDRWLEGESCLATAYAVLALEEVMASAVTASPSEMVPESKASSEKPD